MVFAKLKSLFSKKRPAPDGPAPGTQIKSKDDLPKVSWIEAADNPWQVRILDLRPFALGLVSMSGNQAAAESVQALEHSDGTDFIGPLPPSNAVTQTDLRFPIDGTLADGVLFAPTEMENKWALFFHQNKIIVVRSWTKNVQLIAHCTQADRELKIEELHGNFGLENETSEQTIQLFKYLILTHALGMVHPVPLFGGIEANKQEAAMLAFQLFGNRALFATPHSVKPLEQGVPIRSHSLMHIAIAKGDRQTVKHYLDQGMPIDLIAADGLATVHWTLACHDPTMLDWLIERGAPVDMRSSQGATALMNAVQDNVIDRCGQLLKLGADVNAKDDRGFTALHRACEMGHRMVAEMLLNSGADVQAEVEGITAMTLAQHGKHKKIVGLLNSRLKR